ncbi:chemotaxis protein CheW [Coleofasciculus sp. FACHB-1120]|uniref:chemotaxis protein CheW n=1 Tax=Coleofasciculus sp. FACHB-1120 TaxID=2692783 RepID=UPI001687BABC|nr:chemotaxis protein CheW [Coleofasciculus sp. FACHB-1120]MBD2742446.1 chemotaxis protein CheW [Coleofasciculus sp. FACHB-1120]
MNRRFRAKPLISTRIAKRKLVSFQMGSEQYAIAIDRVQRVLKAFTPHTALTNGRRLMEYEQEAIALIDLSALFLKSHETDYHYLIVCTLNQKEKLGIPVSEMPKILEVLEDKFDKIPAFYQHEALPAAIEKIIHAPDGNLVFYLNLDQLELGNQ